MLKNILGDLKSTNFYMIEIVKLNIHFFDYISCLSIKLVFIMVIKSHTTHVQHETTSHNICCLCSKTILACEKERKKTMQNQIYA